MLHHFTAKNHFGLKLQHGMAFCRCCWLLLFLAVYYWGNSIVTLDNESWLVLGAILPRLRSFLGSLKITKVLVVQCSLAKTQTALFLGRSPYLHACLIVIGNSLINIGIFHANFIQMLLLNSPFTVIFYYFIYSKFFSGTFFSFVVFPNIFLTFGLICYNFGNFMRNFLPESTTIFVPSLIFINELIPELGSSGGGSSNNTNTGTNYNQYNTQYNNVNYIYKASTRRMSFTTRYINNETRGVVAGATLVVAGVTLAYTANYNLGENIRNLTKDADERYNNILNHPKSTPEDINKASQRMKNFRDQSLDTYNPLKKRNLAQQCYDNNQAQVEEISNRPELKDDKPKTFFERIGIKF